MTIKEMFNNDLEMFIEKNFNRYFEYYINEHDTIAALKKSYNNNWSFEDCKKYF